jgi:hypothetical protein
VKRATRNFLLAGCALVLLLEAPAMLAVVTASWNGPYAERDTRTAAAAHVPSPTVARLPVPGR